jgi:hypothetical protein
MHLIVNPLSPSRVLEPIQTVFRVLASQNNCDGEPYDQMIEAANYIDRLEEIIDARKEKEFFEQF